MKVLGCLLIVGIVGTLLLTTAHAVRWQGPFIAGDAAMDGSMGKAWWDCLGVYPRCLSEDEVANFSKSITVILKHEGGYINHPNDPGGETNFGISKRSYPDLDIAGLTREDAVGIYHSDYWQYDGIVDDDLATKVFDLAVNMGQRRANRLLQRAINRVNEKIVVAIDGKLGPHTLREANKADPKELLEILTFLQKDVYFNLAENNWKRKVFLAGWLKRADN